MSRLLYISFLLLFLGCGTTEPLVVYCDPWLEEFAADKLAKYTADHPGFLFELSVVPSEVIAANIRFGQPVDIVFSADPELVSLSRKKEIFVDSIALGDDRVTRFKSTKASRVSWNNHCLAIAATGTSLRRYSEQWLGVLNPSPLPGSDSICRIYPELFSLMRDYLSRRYVDEALAFSRLQNWVPELEIVAQGPEIKGLYQLFVLSNGRAPIAAKKFADFIKLEKSAGILVH